MRRPAPATPDQRLRLAALLVALAVALLVAIRLTTPIGALASDAAPHLFSAGRAMADVRAIGHAPHAVGTAAHRAARAYLVARLRALGLDVAVEQAPQTANSIKRLGKWSGQDASRVPLFNIVATWPGADRAAPAILLMAHYDTVWGSPGAADDSAGVATLLEDVRALKAAGVAPRRDLILLLSDGEETGLAGAHRFFENEARARRIGMVVNHETRGGGGRTAMFETGRENGAAMRLFARAVPHPMVTSLSVLVYRAMPNSTDLTVALARGLPGYNFAFIGRPSLYHSPLATPERIEPAAIQDMGDQSLALVGALATAPALPARGPDATFASLLGLATIVYAPAWGWLIVGVAGGLLAVAWAGRREAEGIGAGAIGRGALLALWAVAAAAPLLGSANALSTGAAHPNYYDRLAAIPRLELQAALLCLASLAWGVLQRSGTIGRRATAVLLLLASAPALLGEQPLLAAAVLPALALTPFLPRRPIGLWPAWLGALALLFGLSLLVQTLAPTAAPLFAWPLLVGAGAAAIAARGGRGWLAVTLPLGLALGQTLALAHFTFSGVGAPLPWVVLPYLAVTLALLTPLMPPRRGSTGAIALLVVAGFAIALWVRLDPLAPSVPVAVVR